MLQLDDFCTQLGRVDLRFRPGVGVFVRSALVFLLVEQVGIEFFVFDQAGDPVVLLGLAVLEPTQTGQDDLQRGHDRLGGRGQQLAQDQPDQVPLARGNAVAVIAEEVA